MISESVVVLALQENNISMTNQRTQATAYAFDRDETTSSIDSMMVTQALLSSVPDILSETVKRNSFQTKEQMLKT